MTDYRNFVVKATLADPEADATPDEIEDALDDIGATVSGPKEDGSLVVEYEATGNVSAIQHAQSLLSELDELGLEATRLTLVAREETSNG